MRDTIPFGSIQVTGGAGTILLGTTAVLMNSWAAASGSDGANTSTSDGDVSVVPDKANNRIKCYCPGIYKYSLDVSGVVDGAQDLSFQLRKNAVAIANTKKTQRFGTTENAFSMSGTFTLTVADNPGTLAAFPDTDASAGQYKPGGSFVGASGAPKVLAPIDVQITSGAGTPTITVKEATLLIERIG
ncbi:MAG: hypothetical protein ACRC7O_05180 [Fimbriiglobus sp.]